MREQITAYIGLGGNLGDRADALRRAVRALAQRDGIKVTKRSALYETEPVGPPQPRFLNAAVEVETTLAPRELLVACLDIEEAVGRARRAGTPKDSPRVIDLDILLYGDEVVADPDLIVPHPHLHTRAFALAPLVDIAGQVMHPALGRKLSDLLREVGWDGVSRIEDTL
ncbi:MAG TPA: 2-amino-4-hydroxy-6-hydroxymethyldihydropteridine diphosphokinase [Polyangia bacterium]|nr:2-amino-4-hydroxy-6-hydroxymethyldihydropteridine diphosphokinase [Polyangia bacterium]